MRILFLCLLLLAPAVRAQNGLTGNYYDTASFTTPAGSRTDATVDFAWGTAIPAGTSLTSADTFSVVWTGQIEPEFSHLYTFHVTADDGARLWVDDRLLVARTYYTTPSEMRGQILLRAGQRVNLRLEYIEQSGSAGVKLEWSSASVAREVIPSARLFPSRVAKAGGSLLEEHWSGIAGGTIAALTADPNYPAKPGGREFITSFECLARDWSDSRGTRVTGFIVPPATGNYQFAVSGDEVVELYLSSDASAANKVLVAIVTAATGFRDWNAQPGQQSAPLPLVQGRRYYVELLHKEDSGTDHWSVAWKKPGDADFSVVPGEALLQPGLSTAQPAQAALLDTMARDHPRIFATPARFAKLRATWQSPVASQPKTWAQNAINSANTILTEAVVTYAPDVRGTILSESRRVVDRMYKLGTAWQLTGDSQYAERAWTELSAVAAFPDWHPGHFLDTAEMTHACAIGYDWFYHYWSQPRRDTIRNAIINLGLNPGLSQFTSNVSWSRSTGNNWNMVCNGGLSLGALAVGTESEALAENILNRALNSTRPVWAHFTTDCGAWYEGPGYWGYTTEYGIRMFAGLEWVLGSDFGISGTQGVSESGFAPIGATGPTNIIFNFADAGPGGPTRGPVFQWMARRYGKPVFAWWENQGGGGALDALWHSDSTASVAGSATPVDTAFHGDAGTAFQPQEMVTMRGKWNDSRATFVGCKGGEMGAAHGNLDAGTFVLDALGKRWFHDLGGDNYALPGYFSDNPSSGTDRWDYYRMRPEGQNTLTIAPSANADMVLDAVAPLLAFQSEAGGSESFAIHNLTPVYSGMTRVWRGTRLTGKRDEVLVQDEIQAASGKTVWWFGHYTSPATTVTIDPDGTSAMMTQGAERLWCKIVSGGGTFQIMDAVPLPSSPNPAGQNANTGHKKLAIQLTNVTNTTLALWFVPLSAGEAVPAALPVIAPLSTWNLAATNDPPAAINGGATGNGDNAVDIDLRGYVTDDSTPPEQMRFSVSGGVNGTVVLLDDGHTARFTPAPGYTGVPLFSFTATDTSPDPRVLAAYDFDEPDAAVASTVPDVSGNGRHGTIDFAGAGSFQMLPDHPAALSSQGARSVDLAEAGTTAARLKRSVTAAELNWNTADWTVSGWFKRRDTANDDIVWHISDGDGFGSNNEIYVNCPAGLTTVRLQHHNGTIFDVDIPQTGIAAGTWHHFAVVRDGPVLSFFVNGTLAGSDSDFTFALDQNSPLVFGGHANPAFQPGRWFDGQLDDLAVFSAALAPEEIAPLAAGLTVRHFGGLSAQGSITLSAAPVTYLWNNTTPSTPLPWSNGSHWTAAVAPVAGRGTALQFFTGQTLAGGTINPNHDLGSGFVLNSLSLAGTSSAATTVTIDGGGLHFLNNGLLDPVVNLTATNGTGLTYDIATPLTLGAATTFNASGSATFRFSGAIDGGGDLLKSGTGKLILSGPNSSSGDTVISAGTLQIGADGAGGSLGSGEVTNNATLRFERTGTLTVPNPIGGSGGLYIDCPINAGTIVLSGINSFDGGVTVNSGALRITNSHALGDGTKTIVLNNGTAGAPQLRLDGSLDPIELPSTFSFTTSSNTGAVINEAGDNRIGGNFTLTGGGGATKLLVSAGTLAIEGNLMPNTTGRALDLAGAGTGLITGNVLDGTAPNVLAVVKSDSGTWTLAGSNTWTGNTSVNAGTLVMNGSKIAGGTVTVATAAKLAGQGSIAANTVVNGTLQPGDGFGTISFSGTLSFGSASRIAWELGDNIEIGTAIDKVNAAGVSITTNAAIDLLFNRPGSTVDFRDGFWGQARTWPVIAATSVNGTFKLGTIGSDINGRPASGYGAFTLQHAASAVNLVWTPLPPIQQWRFTHFATNANSGNAADLADVDRDGMVNLLEYALGGDPNLASTAPLPLGGEAGGKLALSFTRRPSATDLTLTVQAADSPVGPWSNLAASSGGGAFVPLVPGAGISESGEGDVRAVEVRDVYLRSDPEHPRRFMRLQVER